MALAAQEERSGSNETDEYDYDLVDTEEREAEDRFSLSFCNAFSNVCTPLCVSSKILLQFIPHLSLKFYLPS